MGAMKKCVVFYFYSLRNSIIKFEFIFNFFNLHTKTLENWENVLCKKLHFFWRFFRKIAQNRRNSAFFAKIPVKDGTYTGSIFGRLHICGTHIFKNIYAQKFTFF